MIKITVEITEDKVETTNNESNVTGQMDSSKLSQAAIDQILSETARRISQSLSA